MKLGAHVSVAGGLHNGVAEALAIGADTFQMFSKNQRQWIAKPLTDEQRDQFHTALDRKSTRLNSSHKPISYAVFCLKKKITRERRN